MNGFCSSHSTILNESTESYKTGDQTKLIDHSSSLCNLIGQQPSWVADLKKCMANDISQLMLKRAELGYGLNASFLLLLFV